MRKGQQRAVGGSSCSELEAINGTMTASILILGSGGAVGVGAVIYIFQLEPSKCLCQRWTQRERAAIRPLVKSRLCLLLLQKKINHNNKKKGGKKGIRQKQLSLIKKVKSTAAKLGRLLKGIVSSAQCQLIAWAPPRWGTVGGGRGGGEFGHLQTKQLGHHPASQHSTQRRGPLWVTAVSHADSLPGHSQLWLDGS